MSNQTVDVLEKLKEKIHYELNFNWELEQKITDVVSMHFDKAITEQQALPDREADMFANPEKTNTLSERVSESGITRTCVREAFISKAKELGIYYGASETGEFFSTETRAGWEFWNARQAEVDQLQHQSNEQVELSLIYEGALQEKQKRIDELEKNIKAMINHFAYSRDLAREEWKKRPDAYQDGKSDAYAMSHQWAEKALGSK